MTSPPGPDRRPETTDAVTVTAASLADEVLAEAAQEARERARERLVDVLADAIVDAARSTVPTARPTRDEPDASVPPPERAAPSGAHAPREHAPREDAHAPAGEPGPGEQVLYLYAVTRAGVPAPAVTGLDGSSPVSTREDGTVALLVSRVDPGLLHGLEDEPVTEEGRLATLVRRHDAVVTAAFAQAPVLPLRFGTLLRDEDAAAEFVSARAQVLTDQLDHLAGGAEYTVRVVDHGAAAGDRADDAGDETTSATVSGRPPTEGPEDRSGTTYLTRRRDALAARDARRTRVADALDVTGRQLATHAAEVVAAGRARPHEGVVFECAYLVADERRDDFLAAAERASQDLSPSDLEVVVQGPWPPYSFARVEPGEDGHG